MSTIAAVRLLQLASQALPVGGYSHSHGLESAIDTGVVRDEASAAAWIGDVLVYCMASYEIPYLLALHRAWNAADMPTVVLRNEEFLASREASELRAATVQMGYSLRSLLTQLPDVSCTLRAALLELTEPSLPCVWSAAAVAWSIDAGAAARGYLWAWAENQVLVAVKTVPLGQSAGQRMLFELGSAIARVLDAAEAHAIAVATRWAHGAQGSIGHGPSDRGLALANFAPGLAIAAARHETQYSRLFRS